MKFGDLPHDKAALAIFPSVDGFGWALFDGPLSIVDREVCRLAKSARGDEEKNARCLQRAEVLLDWYRPAMLVLEDFESLASKRHTRIRELCRSLISAAAIRGIPTRVLSREQVLACFKSKEVETRYETALFVAEHLPELRQLMPDKRRAWQSEFPNMALFAAVALLIVHYSNPAEPL
ncbi:MAG: hypothetical protein JST16_04975 [Bdellovibrionales bacterium]|nr:hypothetical protein [Bdellovibrionales bacterium]